MSNKRTVNGFEIIQSIEIGHTELVLGHAETQREGLHFMTGYCERNDIYEIYRDVMLSNDYAEILSIFGQRVADEAKVVYERLQAEDRDVGQNDPMTKELCQGMPGWNLVQPTDDLNGKVLVIKPDVLRYEYQRLNHQLVRCGGGFGASPNARGSAIFCTNIYSGQRSRYERRDILAVIEPEALAEYAEWSPWITEGLNRIEQKETKDKGGEAR